MLASLFGKNDYHLVVTPEDVVHGKPAPDMFLLAAQRLGVQPLDCLVVEDGEPGMIGARAAGMAVAALIPLAVAARS